MFREHNTELIVGLGIQIFLSGGLAAMACLGIATGIVAPFKYIVVFCIVAFCMLVTLRGIKASYDLAKALRSFEDCSKK